MAGRPRIYNDPEELNQECDNYFLSLKGGTIKPTVTGLALFLGFASKQSLYDYEKNELFSYPIKKALLQVENSYETSLYSNAVAGPIFALKNMGWADKSEVENKLTVTNFDGMSTADLQKLEHLLSKANGH